MRVESRSVLARNLRRLRELRGLSQEALADEAGINRGYISDLERETSSATTDRIDRLAKALKVRPCELIDETARFG